MSSRDYFAEVAGAWDQMRSVFFSEAVREKALSLAGLCTGHAPVGLTAADLGAGTGFVTEALLAQGLTVFAVDQSPAMLDELRAKFAATGRITTLVGQAEALPLPNASVEYVFANMFLHHVDDPAKAIAEMARVLRPGGRVVITDLDSHAHQFLLTEHHDRWPGFARAEVSAWLAAAGLSAVAVDCAGQNCCAQSSTGSVAACVSIFVASATKPVATLRPQDLDPLAVGLRARSFMDADRPLLCAESVLLAVAEALGVRSPLIPRMATGFCSGLARSCGPCGAFSAGVMALGLALGRDSSQDELDDSYGPVLEYRDFFLARFGSLNCQELTGQDLGTAEGQLAYREAGLKLKVCAPVLEQCAAQLIRILTGQ